MHGPKGQRAAMWGEQVARSGVGAQRLGTHWPRRWQRPAGQAVQDNAEPGRQRGPFTPTRQSLAAGPPQPWLTIEQVGVGLAGQPVEVEDAQQVVKPAGEQGGALPLASWHMKAGGNREQARLENACV